jgi:hypothetical protein
VDQGWIDVLGDIDGQDRRERDGWRVCIFLVLPYRQSVDFVAYKMDLVFLAELEVGNESIFRVATAKRIVWRAKHEALDLNSSLSGIEDRLLVFWNSAHGHRIDCPEADFDNFNARSKGDIWDKCAVVWLTEKKAVAFISQCPGAVLNRVTDSIGDNQMRRLQRYYRPEVLIEEPGESFA